MKVSEAAGELAAYLAPTEFVDSDSPAVLAFAAEAVGDASSDLEKGSRLFLAVRDAIRYDPYTISADPAAYRASTVAGSRAAYCIPKAILLAAAARAVGIPARPGFADVRNHLASEKLLARMGTDLFVFHGYAELYLGDRWVKATPAFNASLCARFGVPALEFDGSTDSLLHPFDGEGRRYMEYVHEHGTFVDMPFELMLEVFRRTYGEQIFNRLAGRDEMFHAQGPAGPEVGTVPIRGPRR
ncbi:MAG: transglutaminase-like domain-containing protein [Acidimicrobiia bacterium]